MAAEAFGRIVAAIDYPMYVVTTRDSTASKAAGCLVGFAGQVSIKPERFLVALSRENHTYRIARDATHLAVHLLSGDATELASLFGGSTEDSIDKFSRCEWTDGPANMPVLADATAWFVGRILTRWDCGDHMGHLLEPIAGYAPEHMIDWLTFSSVRDLSPGHEP